jgi:REP element-mobilizing transposase RayT
MYSHIIFSTKDREPYIARENMPRLFEYIGGILRAARSVLVAAGGMPDHVHLLVSLGKEASVAETVRLIKSNSSKWIHEAWSNFVAFAWQAGYGAFSVSWPDIPDLERYIARQEEHHRHQTYQDEFRVILKAHDVEYDERYLWD